MAESKEILLENFILRLKQRIEAVTDEPFSKENYEKLRMLNVCIYREVSQEVNINNLRCFLLSFLDAVDRKIIGLE